MDVIVQGMKFVIEWVYGFSGDYGIAIVLITVAVRAMLLPLNIQQRRQMKGQKEVSEEIEKLRIKYRNNKRKLDEEIQKLYKEKGIGGKGCLVTLLQLPVMMCLYRGIRLTAAAGTTTVLLPWVSSLLLRDPTFLLPIATLAVQFLPQMYPYIGFFKDLQLQKMPLSMVLVMVFANSIFAFAIPSGVGLYYLASGIFSAVEQLVMNFFMARKAKAVIS